MTQEILKFLQLIAEKLGTTAEYLWSILIVQARISAITDLFYYGAIIWFSIFLYKKHVKYSTKEDGGGRYDTAYDNNDALPVIMVVAGIVWIVLVIAAFFSVEDTITKFINPEYWALRHLMR